MSSAPLVSTQFNLASAWEAVADHRRDALALHCGDVSRTWGEFEHRSARLAGALAEVGIGADDNTALALYNGNGGGLYNTGSTVTISNSQILTNTAGSRGGGTSSMAWPVWLAATIVT